MSQAVYVSTSVLAKQAPLALSNAAGARMCKAHSLFVSLKVFVDNK